MKKIILLLSFFFTSWTFAQNFEGNANCNAAYEAIMELRLEEAKEIIKSEKAANPDNLLPLLLENYPEMFVVFFNEQEADFKQYKENVRKRLDLLEDGDKKSPYYRYCQAEIKMQTAIVRLKFGEYITAMREMKSAYSLLKKNKQIHPDFAPNLKTMGIVHTLVGTVPGSYKWLLKILGLNGSVKQGLGELQTFMEAPPQLFQKEGTLIYSYLLIFADTQYDLARNLIETQLSVDKSGLDNFVAATIYYRLGQSNKGITVIEKCPEGKEYFHLYMLDFMMGTLKFYKQDPQAVEHLKYFTNNFKGMHYVKTAHLRLAWYYLLAGDETAYKEQMRLISANGGKIIDCDKKAAQEAEKTSLPNVYLLKAQLLFDGGYFDNSLEILLNITAEQLRNSAEELEYTYRLARNYEGLSQNENAIHFYQQTIERDGNSLAYFRAKSALQIGLIYERMDNQSNAIHWFKKAIELPSENYKNSIEQQAKAGLSRLGG